MSDLHILLCEYLATRRALGAKLELSGRLLKRFTTFAAQHQTTVITTGLALRWATEPSHADPVQWANRLGMVRRFARKIMPRFA